VDGLFGIDIQGRFSFIDPVDCVMLGLVSEHVIGKVVHPLAHHRYLVRRPYSDIEYPIDNAIAEGRGIRVADVLLACGWASRARHV
jgi:PAS domain-containing protein